MEIQQKLILVLVGVRFELAWIRAIWVDFTQGPLLLLHEMWSIDPDCFPSTHFLFLADNIVSNVLFPPRTLWFFYHISFDWYLFLFSRTFYSNVIFGYFSLENISDKIRWSLDLRWQRPDKPNGFYGLKVYWQCQDGDLVAHVVKKKYRAIDEAIKLRRFIQMTTLSWSFSQAR